MDAKRLYRSSSNRMVGGVCAGIGDYLGIDPSVVRLSAAFAGLLGYAGPLLIGYLVMLLVIPEEPAAASQPPVVIESPVEQPTEQPAG